MVWVLLLGLAAMPWRTAIAEARRMQEAIAHCESVRDYVSRGILESILDGEEDHIDWLETQLSVIERIGEPNYLLTKLED